MKEITAIKQKKESSKKKKTTKIPSPSSKLSTKKSPNWMIGLIALVLGLVAGLMYAPSTNFDFVYDDDAVIKDNKFVHKGIDGLGDIWSTSYFEGYNEHLKVSAFRPIPLTTFALEYEFFGLKPSIHHLINVLIYALTGCLLFLFLARLFEHKWMVIAAMASLFFVLHPLHVEVVSNIKSRDELIAFFSYIFAFHLLLKAIDQSTKAWLIPSFLVFLVALFSKESVITTVAIIPLALYFFRQLSFKQIAAYSSIYLVAAGIYLVYRVAILGGLNEGTTLTALDNSLLAADNLSTRIASNIFVIGYYFYKTIIPHPLLSDYSYSTIPLVGWNDWRVYISILTYTALVGFAIWGLRKRQLFSFSILYYFITISLFTSIVFTNFSAYNDRFQYNASLGICLLLAWAVYQLFKSKSNDWSLDWLRQNSLGLFLVLVISCMAVWKTSTQIPVWENRNTLFGHDILYSPNNARMNKNHGASLARKAMSTTNVEEKNRLTNEALTYLQKAVSIYDRIPTAHVHIGNMYINQKKLTEAEAAYNKAASINPTDHFANANLASIYYQTGRYQEAANKMATLNPSNFKANEYYLLSLIYGRLGDHNKASEYKKLSGR